MKMNKKLMTKKINNIGLLVQFILAVIVIILSIISIFVNELFQFAEIVISLTLFVIAYNNQKIYKRKMFTIIYTLIGIFILISALVTLYGL